MLKNNSPIIPSTHLIMQKVREISAAKILTNNGPMLQELEDSIREMFKVKHVIAVNNATIGLMLALDATCNKKGKIITTPFSFIATRRAIEMCGYQAVYCDVDEYGNLDPSAVERAICDDVVGIMPVHVYGQPCDVRKFDEISEKYAVPVIYDAAHCFDVKVNGRSITEFGAVSVISTHATKVFNSVEGGLICTQNSRIADKITSMRNFGIQAHGDSFDCYGLNGKMSEIHAAYGVLNLAKVKEAILYRKRLQAIYYNLIARAPLSNFLTPIIREEQITELNGSYMPVLFSEGQLIQEIINFCTQNGVELRRYFFPLICDKQEIQKYRTAMNLSNSVVTLPLHTNMDEKDIHIVVNTITEAIK